MTAYVPAASAKGREAAERWYGGHTLGRFKATRGWAISVDVRPVKRETENARVVCASIAGSILNPAVQGWTSLSPDKKKDPPPGKVEPFEKRRDLERRDKSRTFPPAQAPKKPAPTPPRKGERQK